MEALLHEAHLRRELLVHGRREAPERRVERVRRGPAREAERLHRHRKRQRRPRLRRLDLSYRPDLFKVQETSSPFIEHSYFLTCSSFFSTTLSPMFVVTGLYRIDNQVTFLKN